VAAGRRGRGRAAFDRSERARSAQTPSALPHAPRPQVLVIFEGRDAAGKVRRRSTHTRTHTRTRAHTQARAHTRTHARAHARTRARTHARTHARSLRLGPALHGTKHTTRTDARARKARARPVTPQRGPPTTARTPQTVSTARQGGVIKRITEPLNHRGLRVAALAAPTEQERSQWYFQVGAPPLSDHIAAPFQISARRVPCVRRPCVGAAAWKLLEAERPARAQRSSAQLFNSPSRRPVPAPACVAALRPAPPLWRRDRPFRPLLVQPRG
jgi:hypothetical protein